MSILNLSIKHTRFLLLYLLGVAALVTSQLVFAAEITRERGTGSQPEAIRIRGALNLGDEEKFKALAVELHPNLTQDLHPILTHPI